MGKRFALSIALFLLLHPNAEAMDRIRIAVSNPNMPNLTSAVAQTKGFFKAEEIAAEIIRMNPNVAITALASGDIDYCQLFGAVVAGAIAGLPVRVVVGFINNWPLTLIAQPEYGSVKDLKGKTLGVSSYGATPDVAARLMFKHFGVDPEKEIKVLALGSDAARITALKQKVVDVIVISPPADALSFIRRWNAYGAEIRQRYANRAVVFTSTIPCGGEPFLKELERAILEYDLKGVLINSSHQGAYPDDDEARPFFELVTRLGIPVMMHVPSVGFGEERMRDYWLASSVGRPSDKCLSIARLIVRGVFEQFPDLKFVGCHLGGGICEVIGRMDYAYELRDAASGLGPYEPMLISKAPSQYLKKLFMDTVSYHSPAIMCAYQTVGAKQLLFGSDAPPLLPLLPRAKRIIEELPISQAGREDIFSRNALKLMERGKPGL